jgi:hypothetical protein
MTFISTVPDRTDIGTTFGTTKEGRRTVGSGTGGATGSVRGVHEILLGTRTRVP